ncbi:MAG: histidine phosphatase family protein [Anaerolineae bacterium]|nr:histidine phosphatase family protein [Anaerolineae bacterium]
MTTIHFVRHGEVHNPNHILYARMPGFYLSATGHRQAQCTARILKLRPIVAVYSSPMSRAVQTADYAAYECGLELHTSTLINEIYTPYTGWPIERLEAMRWDLYTDIPEEYETWPAILARVQQFCDTLCQAYPGGEVVATTHGDIVITAAMWAEGLPLDPALRDNIPYPNHASITSLHFAPDAERPQRTYDDPFAHPIQNTTTASPHTKQ